MSVNLSMFAGVGAQLFTDSGTPLSGGKIYSYAAGTTTPQATYTTNAGNVAHANPIVLNAAGRVPSGGEIWITDNQTYKFAVYTSDNVLIATYDNIGTGDFFANLAASSGSSLIGFIQAGTGAVATTVQAKLRQTISVQDFGATGDGATDDTADIQAALTYANSVGGATIHVPAGIYKLTDTLSMGANTALIADDNVTYMRHHTGTMLDNALGINNTVTNYEGNGNIIIDGGIWNGNSVAFYDSFNHFAIGQGDNIKVKNCTFLDNIRAHAVDLSACRNVWIENNKFLGFSKYKHSPNGYGTSSDNLGETSSSVTFTDSTDLITSADVEPANGESIQFSVISGTTGISIDTWYFVVNSTGASFQVSATFNGTPITLSGNGTGTMVTWIRNYAEAVQLDHNVPGSFFFGATNGTPNVNVFFNNNVVGPNPALTNNTFTSWGAGIGSHGSSTNKYMQNIVVEGNSFTECGFSAVRPWKWVGVTITGNVFRGCVIGIRVTPSSANKQSGSDYTITGNVFESYTDIGVFFPAPTAAALSPTVFYTNRVTISGNTFSNGTTNSAIEIAWIDGLTCSNNVFSNVFRGFEIDYCRNAVISNNTLKDATREFMYWSDLSPTTGIAGSSQNAIISNNQANNLGYSGMNIQTVTNLSITGNLIIGASTFEPTRYGITVSNVCLNGLVSDNTVLDGGATNKPDYSIYITSTCTNISLGANKVFKGVTGETFNESASPGRTLQGLTTIDSTGYGSASKPALLLKGFGSTEGEIAVPSGESLGFGQFNETTSVYTQFAELQSDGDFALDTAGQGFIAKTPDGTKSYRISVNNAGSVISTLV